MKTEYNVIKALSIGAFISLFGCDNKTSTRSIEAQPKVTVTVSAQMDSKTLTDAAEQLLAPHTFMLSYQTASMALAKDPSNIKAEFYVKLLKRFEAFRGLYSRVKPKSAEDQKKLNDSNSKMPVSPLKDFLNDKGADIKDISSVQDVLSEYHAAINDFRIFLKEKENSELEINLNPLVFQDMLRKDAIKNCDVIERTSKDDFKLECDFDKVATRKLNIADLITLRQITSAELLYSLLNNYSLTGLEKLSEVNPNGKMTNQEVTNFLFSQENFGQLRSQHLFGSIKQIGVDLVAAVKWAEQYQSSICPKGFGVNDQRKGYLYRNGLCFNPENKTDTDRLLSLLEKTISGPIEVDLNKENGNSEVRTVDLFKFTENPIGDLRKIKPMGWDKCGQVISFYDNSIGGLFPNVDGHLALKNECQ